MAENIQNYFSHDSNARNDTKILNLRAALGAEGYGIYFMLLERLRNSTDYASVIDYNAIAFDLRVSAGTVKRVVEDFRLFSFTENGERFYSESLLRRMKIKDEKKKDISEKRRAAANKRWEQEKNQDIDDDLYNSNAIAMQVHTKKMQNDAKEKKRKEKERKGNKRKDNTPPSINNIYNTASFDAEIDQEKFKKVVELYNYSGFQNISPSVKDTLIEFTNTYPMAWLEEAFKIATDGGKLSLNYIRGILMRWTSNGKDSQFKKKDSQTDTERYYDQVDQWTESIKRKLEKK